MPWLTTAEVDALGSKRPVLYVRAASLRSSRVVAQLIAGVPGTAEITDLATVQAWPAEQNGIPMFGVIVDVYSTYANFALTDMAFFKGWSGSQGLLTDAAFRAYILTTPVRASFGNSQYATAFSTAIVAGPQAANMPTSEEEEEEEDDTETVETPAVVEPPGNEDGQTSGGGGMLASPIPQWGVPLSAFQQIAQVIVGALPTFGELFPGGSNRPLGPVLQDQIIGGGTVVFPQQPIGPSLPSGNFISTAQDRRDLATLANSMNGYILDAGTAGADNAAPVLGLASIGAASLALVPVARSLAALGTPVYRVAAGAGGTIANFVGQTVYRIPGGTATTNFLAQLPAAVTTLVTGAAGYLLAKGIDVVIDFPFVGGGSAGFEAGQVDSWQPSTGDAVGVGQGGAFVTKVWYANNVPFVALSDGRIGAQRKTGAWRFWRPRKPVAVVYSDGVGDIRDAVKAGKALGKQARQLKTFVDKFGPQPRRKRQPKPMVVDQDGKRVSIDNYDVR